RQGQRRGGPAERPRRARLRGSGGRSRPVSHAAVMTESVLHAPLLHARPDFGAFAVTGGERLAWLNGLVTQNVGKLAPGAGAYGLAVGKTGKIMAELWFIAAADRVFVLAARSRIQTLREHFDRHLVMEDAEIGPDLDRGAIFVHGATAALLDEARTRGADV